MRPSSIATGRPARVQTINAYDPDGHLVSVMCANGAAPVVMQTSYTPTGKVAN